MYNARELLHTLSCLPQSRVLVPPVPSVRCVRWCSLRDIAHVPPTHALSRIAHARTLAHAHGADPTSRARGWTRLSIARVSPHTVWQVHRTGSGKTGLMIQIADNYFLDRRPKVLIFPTTAVSAAAARPHGPSSLPKPPVSEHRARREWHWKGAAPPPISPRPRPRHARPKRAQAAHSGVLACAARCATRSTASCAASTSPIGTPPTSPRWARTLTATPTHARLWSSRVSCAMAACTTISWRTPSCRRHPSEPSRIPRPAALRRAVSGRTQSSSAPMATRGRTRATCRATAATQTSPTARGIPSPTRLFSWTRYNLPPVPQTPSLPSRHRTQAHRADIALPRVTGRLDSSRLPLLRCRDRPALAHVGALTLVAPP